MNLLFFLILDLILDSEIVIPLSYNKIVRLVIKPTIIIIIAAKKEFQNIRINRIKARSSDSDEYRKIKSMSIETKKII
jgi:hypothetical protein